MANATKDQVDVLAEIEKLRVEAETQGGEYHQLLSQANDVLTKRKETLRKIGELANQAAGDDVVPMNGSHSGANGSIASNTGGLYKPPAAKNTTSNVGKNTAGRGKNSTSKNTTKNTTKGRRGRPASGGASNEHGLKRTIWDILSRNPSSHRKVLSDYPTDGYGLKVAEIKEIIEKEGAWKSTASNISPQIQSHLFNMKEKKMLFRDPDSRRYYIVDGATYE